MAILFLFPMAPDVRAGDAISDPVMVRIRLDLVPQELQGDIDTCAIDRLPDGPYAVFMLDPSAEDALTVPHEPIGRLSEYVSRFLPVNTLSQIPIPSIESLPGIPHFDRSGAPSPRIGTTLSWDRYHNRAEGVQFLQTLAAAFPNIVQLQTIGLSRLGQPIIAMKISDNPAQVEPGEERILFTGETHAREWATHETVLYLAQYLTNRYATDAVVRRIVDNSEVWLVPTVNPDGFDYSWTNERMWRKNRRDNPGTSCDGVDINRNYPYHWGGPGASTNTCDETYRGPSAGSEPETQAIVNLLTNQRFAIGVGFHTYSQLALYSWGDTTSVTPEGYTSLRAIAKKYAQITFDTHGKTYLPGQGSYTIYLTSGGFDDQSYGAHGTLGFTPEMRPETSQQGGFLLPEDQILPNNEENAAAAIWLMQNVADALSISNPNLSTLFALPGSAASWFALPQTPVNQKPGAALGLPDLLKQYVRTRLDDASHAPPSYATLASNIFEGCGTGSGYLLDPNASTIGWASAATTYKVLPHVFEDGAEIMLSNVSANGLNVIGVPAAGAVAMTDIRVIKRVMQFAGNTFGYKEVIQEERTALQDLTNATPWLDWTWTYTDPAGVTHDSHPQGLNGAAMTVEPFRAYQVTVREPSSAFGSTTVPVYLLKFPAFTMDCNYNGRADAVDINQGLSLDCNGNGLPDECENSCAGLVPGDLNCSASVNGADIAPFVERLTNSRYTCQADMNRDGLITLDDVPDFVQACLSGH